MALSSNSTLMPNNDAGVLQTGPPAQIVWDNGEIWTAQNTVPTSTADITLTPEGTTVGVPRRYTLDLSNVLPGAVESHIVTEAATSRKSIWWLR